MSATGSSRSGVINASNERELGDRLQRSLGANYTVVRALGAGGFAVVYLVDDLQLKRQLAVKVMSPSFATSESAQRFVREAETVAGLVHPNVVTLHFVGRFEDSFYLAMQYVAGGSLSDRLRRGGRLSTEDAVNAIRDVARGLAHAHKRGIIHRDIKPQNVLVDVESGRCMVADFGVAHTSDSSLTGSGEIFGTPLYLSPEQVLGEPYDQRADIYALGVMAYELVTGKPPFEAPTPVAAMLLRLSSTPRPIRELRPDLPSTISDVITRCLARSAADRYPDADAVVRALGDQTVPIDPIAGIVPGQRRIVRRVVLATASVVVFGVLGLASWQRYKVVESRPATQQRAVEILRVARQQYYSGNYDAALSLLKDIPPDGRVERGHRLEALRYMARSDVALGRADEAKRTVKRMLGLEPPIALLIPSLESEQLMRIYQDARAETRASTPRDDVTPIAVLAIFPFLGVGGDTSFRDFGSAISDFLVVDLVKVGSRIGLKLVDRTRAFSNGKAIADISDSTYYELDDVVRPGIRPIGSSRRGPLRATHLMFGSYAVTGEDILISAWVYDVNAGDLRISEQHLGSKGDPLQSVNRFSAKVVADFEAAHRLTTSTR